MTRAHIPVLLPPAQWQLVVRTLRGGPKRSDAEQLDTLITHIEQTVKNNK